MKQDMCGIGDDAVAPRKKRVGVSEHYSIALGARWFGLEKIGNPPCAHLPYEKQAVANPKPLIESTRIGLAEVTRAIDEADGEGHALDQGYEHEPA
jgi:hypothetical protein